MRSKFDEELEKLNQEMILMGMLCETAIRRSADALIGHDLKEAGEIAELLEQINRKNREIESLCLRLLLRQQPVAKDLRTISSALKMVTDMERIGVQSVDIAEIIMMDNIPSVDTRLPVKEMSDSVIRMVTDSIDAFVEGDAEKARTVVNYDDVVDRYFDEIKALLITQLKTPEESGETVLDLLMISKYLERIGDHAVNIAIWVIFSITGIHERID